MATPSIHCSLWYIAVAASLAITGCFATLPPHFYQQTCPCALPTIKRVVVDEIRKDPRMGASLLRLHFHDCFVNGCDASVLLDDTSTMQGEKMAAPNNGSLRGFEVIDRIKQEVNQACGANVVSCADILAIAALDSVVALGGPTWKLRLGRRDSLTASMSAANTFLPAPTFDLQRLIKSFSDVGLDQRDLVALSGAHTLGVARCVSFRDRAYSNNATIDPAFAAQLQQLCPRTTSADNNIQPLDPSPFRFDIKYFEDMPRRRGLLHSDQELFNAGLTGDIVRSYITDPELFATDFGNSMVKMGSIKPLTGQQGQIRVNCRRVN